MIRVQSEFSLYYDWLKNVKFDHRVFLVTFGTHTVFGFKWS